MSSHLFHTLEEKITQAIHVIVSLRSQLTAAQEKNGNLQSEITALKNRQLEWEQSLSTLLRKLDSTDLTQEQEEYPEKISSEMTLFHEEEEILA